MQYNNARIHSTDGKYASLMEKQEKKNRNKKLKIVDPSERNIAHVIRQHS